MFRILLCLIIFTIAPFVGNGQKVSISLFNNLRLQTILVTPVSGSYSLLLGDLEYILMPNQIIYISKAGDSVMVRDMATNLGKWERISLIGQTGADIIRVSPITPTSPARVYDDNLGFYVDFERLMAINLVSMPNYVAGVVEAESGSSAHIEFYKAQAILARTYAIGHIDRHVGEGFNLCDEVHCQVYKGRSTHNPDILKAANETNGKVVVDTATQTIVAAFHANCGGQTANSEEVWLRGHYYLTSITDSHCRSMPGASWDVRIPFDDWRDFLRGRGVDVDTFTNSEFAFSTKDRSYYYSVGDASIPMTAIREHFSLRSAYFNVDVTSSNIRLRGRGYGHGVGMCQEGAMQMAKRGSSAQQIIDFYFKDVSVVDVSELEDILLLEDSEDLVFD